MCGTILTLLKAQAKIIIKFLEPWILESKLVYLSQQQGGSLEAVTTSSYTITKYAISQVESQNAPKPYIRLPTLWGFHLHKHVAIVYT